MDFEKIAARFQQRLAETVARYEGDIVVMSMNYESQIEELSKKLKEYEEKDADSGDVVSEKSAEKSK